MRKPEILRYGAIVYHMIHQKSNEPAKVEAYQWLLGVFYGSAMKAVMSDGQMWLF